MSASRDSSRLDPVLAYEDDPKDGIVLVERLDPVLLDDDA